jgi:hypothetical protein
MKSRYFRTRLPRAKDDAGKRIAASRLNTGKVRVGAIVMLSAIGFAFFAAYFRAMPSASPTTPTWGKVLIAGGYGNVGDALSSTELYDPGSRVFSAPADTAAMKAARYGASATLLASGKVLIAGGEKGGSALSSTELYNPATNGFAAVTDTAAMNTARYGATATLLASGKVLIAGGKKGRSALASTELYDPATNSFAAASDTAVMNAARWRATATLLPSGKVLIVGGISLSSYLSSAELYDPATNSFAAASDTPAMNGGRVDATATLLASGQVLIAGGSGPFVGTSPPIGALSSTELYDPATNSFAAAANTAALNTGGFGATATLLTSGQVLIAGGDGYNGYLSSTELYDLATNSFAAAADTAIMNNARSFATATLLPSGQVLIAGGSGASGSLSSTELYDPASNTFADPADVAVMNTARTSAVVVLLPQKPERTPTPTVPPKPRRTPTPTATRKPKRTPTPTTTPRRRTPTPTVTRTPKQSVTPTRTPVPTITTTITPARTATLTPVVTTATITPAFTPLPTGTPTPTCTFIPTATPTPPPLPSPPALVGSDSAGTGSTPASSLTSNEPAAGSLLLSTLVIQGAGASASTVTPPSGWTLIGTWPCLSTTSISDWAASTAYTSPTTILPKAGNPGGYVFSLTSSSCTSGATEPATWNQSLTSGNTTADGNCAWTNIGVTYEIQMAAAYRAATDADQQGTPLTWSWTSGSFVASVVNSTYEGESSNIIDVVTTSQCKFADALGGIDLGDVSTFKTSQTVIAVFGAAGSGQQLASFGPLSGITDETNSGFGPANLNAAVGNPDGRSALQAQQQLAGENVGVGLAVFDGPRGCFVYHGCPYAPSSYDCP